MLWYHYVIWFGAHSAIACNNSACLHMVNLSRSKGHVQSLNMLLQRVFTYKEDILLASVILTRHEAGGMKQEGWQWCTQERILSQSTWGTWALFKWLLQASDKSTSRVSSQHIQNLLFLNLVIRSCFSLWLQSFGQSEGDVLRNKVHSIFVHTPWLWVFLKQKETKSSLASVLQNIMVFILSTSFLLHLNDWEGTEIPIWGGGCSLRSAETQFYSDGA